MARLTVSLLGSFEIKLDDQPVTRAVTGKVRALMAYLAVEADRPHNREVLAGLLWPDYPERSARANLRNTLSNLRTAIGDRDATQPYLQIARETIQFSTESDCWVDVAAFRTAIEQSLCGSAAVSALESAVALYVGPFLEGFSLADSPAFEDWIRVIRERLERQALKALQSLTAYHEERGAYARACEYARQQIALAPWQEQAHQALMRLLALNGQRGAALAQYEACCRVLRAELDVEPGEETRRLYERIRDGELERPTPQIKAPQAIPPVEPSIQAPAATQPIPPARPSSPPAGGTERGLEGERRVITVMFADIKGSTALAGQIDTEDWVEIMNHTLQILSAEIHRYGGQVDRYEGDGLVAFFGLATAHEDDAERAVLAALAMQEAVKRYAAELAARQGIELLLRVGLATGEVIATHVGNAFQHGEATAMGRTIALAARLEPAAKPGTVLVSENTYHLAERSFEWQDIGSIAAKGYNEPVPSYRPLKYRATAGKERGIEGLESPLVGRDEELMALRKAIDRLERGIGGIVTVVGEAGIGKSRLVTELRKRATDGALVQWVEGRCLSYGGSTAYLLWLNMLRDLVHVAQDALPAAAVDALRTRVQALCPDRFDAVYPYLCRLMSLRLSDEYEAVRDMQGESLRAEMFRAVETLIASAAAQRPLVMVCEDLHWADAASLALLDRAVALTDRSALLLICVFRPKVEHPCWQLKENAARLYRHRHTDLWLDALSADESRTLVGHLLRVEALPVELRGKILDRAEGNPFYVEEIIRTLIDDGAIVYDDAAGQWSATRHIADLPIPDTLHGVLMARIDRLEPEAKHVLQLASVIGRIFTYPILSALPSPLPQAGGGAAGRALDMPLLDHLVALERAQLIRERARLPEREYIFKHHLTQEAAYNSLLKREQRIYHRQVAEVLERLYAERIEEQAELLALHWEQARELEEAIHYLHQAGNKAVQLSAYPEARAHLTRALALLEALPDAATPKERLYRAEQELALQLSLGVACWATYDTHPEAAQAFERARELSQQMGQTSQLCTSLTSLAFQRYVEAEYRNAHTLGQRALKLAQKLGDPVLLVESHWGLGCILFALGDYAAAHVHLEQTIAFYQPHHHQALVSLKPADPRPSAVAYDACCLWCLGYPDQALRRSEEALTLARELDHPFTLGDVLSYGCCQLHVMRRDAQALKESAEGLLQSPMWWVKGTVHRGEAVAMLGQLQEGMAQMREGIAAFHAIGARTLLPGTLGSLAVAQAKAGQPQEGLATLAEALDLVAETEEHHWEAELYRLRAELLLVLNDENGAEDSLHKAIEVARRQQAKSWELRATTSLARLWQEQGRTDKARQMLAEIYDWFTEGFDTPDLREAKTLLEELFK